MNEIMQKRFALFLLGCIPVRLAIVVWSLFMSLEAMKLLAIFAGCLCLGFCVIFVMGWRTVGAETFGKPIWWNMMRPVHGVIWGLVAYHAWNGKRDIVWRLLLLDVVLGLGAFFIWHGFLE
jgi:tetrahydromethanopterin S-methyltransferase subunit E